MMTIKISKILQMHRTIVKIIVIDINFILENLRRILIPK